MNQFSVDSKIKLILKIKPLSGDGALIFVLGTLGMIDSAIRVDFEVLLGFEDAIADFAETLVVDQQVSLLEVVGISLLVEHLYIGHVGTNPLVLLHS